MPTSSAPDPDRWITMETDLRAWRQDRPTATWTEIEQEVDRQLDHLRAQLLGDLATAAGAGAACPTCGHPLQTRGRHDRTVITDGGAEIRLTRSYQTCPVCGTGLSPLDQTLGLLPQTSFTPPVIALAVRLGTRLPFAEAASVLAETRGITMDHDTLRRWTERAGQVAEQDTDAAVAAWYASYPDSPPGPALQVVSVDGAMVPLQHGDWAEVRTLAIGEGTQDATGCPQTTRLSYVSRLTDAASFGEVSTLETHRRGTRAATTVVAVTEGAAWIQDWIDGQRADAVRILDFAHAVEHLGAVAKAQFGAGTAEASEWVGMQAHALRHGQEATVLATLAALGATPGDAGDLAAATARYLTSRRDMIHYADFVRAGYPIGSGCVESANKTVVEARLKGAGMHWSRANVTPMLELRTMLRNERWAERWTAIWADLQQQRQSRPCPVEPTASPPKARVVPAPTRRPPTIVNGKPTKDHPWRRSSPFPAKC